MILSRKLDLWDEFDGLMRRRHELLRHHEAAVERLANVPKFSVSRRHWAKRMFTKSAHIQHQIDLLRHAIFHAEQDIVLKEDRRFWASDERLRCLRAALQIYERAQDVNVEIFLDPDTMTIRVAHRSVTLEQTFGYNVAGILACNQIIAPLEDELALVRYRAVKIRSEQQGINEVMALRLAWNERVRSVESRLPDGTLNPVIRNIPSRTASRP